MDPATHALTSFALVRGFFPRHSWKFALSVVLAGTLADLDLLSLLLGPNAYLAGRFTITHSLIGTVAVIAIAAASWSMVLSKSGEPQTLRLRSGQEAGPASTSTVAILLAASLAAIVHLLLDLVTSSGVAFLWPFRQERYAWDVLPATDLWVIALLLGGLLLPELFRLVGSEIGVREKKPRGRNGAIAALVLLLIYVGARATLHANVAAQLDAHSYRGEAPQRVAVFPDSFSLVTWHGVVETETQICIADVPAAQSARFDPERAACTRKPEDSPALAAAQETETAKRFLLAARFPKASVDSIQGGSEVVIRDVRDDVLNYKSTALAAHILLDPNGRMTSQEIVWASHVWLK